MELSTTFVTILVATAILVALRQLLRKKVSTQGNYREWVGWGEFDCHLPKRVLEGLCCDLDWCIRGNRCWFGGRAHSIGSQVSTCLKMMDLIRWRDPSCKSGYYCKKRESARTNSSKMQRVLHERLRSDRSEWRFRQRTVSEYVCTMCSLCLLIDYRTNQMLCQRLSRPLASLMW